MAEAGKRPGAATAGAVIEIIFTAWAIIASIIGLGTGAGYLAMGSALGGVLTLVFSVIGLVVGVLGLIGAILLLSNKKAGIGLSKLWGLERIMNFVAFVITTIIAMSAVTSTAAAAASMADANISSSAFGAGVGIVSAILAIFPMAAPGIVVLILVGLKPVKEYYASLS